MISRRDWLRTTIGGTAAVLFADLAHASAAAAPIKMTVYKDAGCGCCKKWVEHVRQAGFEVEAHDTSNMDEVKANAGVPAQLQSCHTALVGRYAVEGHVPADVIKKMLDEKPNIRGIAVPGMPAGSPGMEIPNGRKERFDIVAFERNGKTRVFATR
jgi:hypothetical protein